MFSRADCNGFYRAMVRKGGTSITAEDPLTGASVTDTLTLNSGDRTSGIDLVIPVPFDPLVPVVVITSPDPDMTIAGSLVQVEGTANVVEALGGGGVIRQVIISTSTPDTADAFPQVVPVNFGVYDATVIVTPGTTNTILVTAQNGDRVGSAAVDVNVTGVASEDVRFTLVWDTNNTDIDLYVRTPGANGVADTVDGTTLFFANPTGDGGMLDIDDVNGFGPENITFPAESATTGTYGFGVQYFGGALPTNATVSVFVGGRLRGSFAAAISEGNFVSLATVSVPSGTIGPAIASSVFGF